jgi:serine/threonine-protein kinase RsbW
VITVTAPADRAGIAVLTAAARAASIAHGGGGDATAILVRLLCEDAAERCTVGEDPLLTLTVDVEGTEVVIDLVDEGEPISRPPASVLALGDLGLATTVHGGVHGKGNRSTVRVPLPGHTRLVEHEGLDVRPPDAMTSEAPVELRALEVEDAAALTRCIYRCYGWSYPAASLYYPDRVASAIAGGRRIGEVAVDESGEVVAHWGASFVSESVVETGATVTDPRFRHRGLADRLGGRLLERLGDLGVRGRIREPVLTHEATQHIALREGAVLVGANLAVGAPFHQVGITDGLGPERVSLTMFYSPLRPLEPATVWVPDVYAPFVERILDSARWPYSLGEGGPSAPGRPDTALTTTYDPLQQAGTVTVAALGDDLVDVVDDALVHLADAGADVVTAYLPAGDPALATVGAGLDALGLSFAAFLPAYGSLGDTLSLQWLADRDVDTSTWRFATPEVESLVRTVVDQARAVGEQITRRRRSAARRREGPPVPAGTGPGPASEGGPRLG